MPFFTIVNCRIVLFSLDRRRSKLSGRGMALDPPLQAPFESILTPPLDAFQLESLSVVTGKPGAIC